MGAWADDWTEPEYLSLLHRERRAYAWVLRHYGALPPEAAEAAALVCYPYEPPDTDYRGLVFHDEAWHWAMLRIHGDRYMLDHPDLLTPPEEYLALE
ncbi:hypothetical protein ACFYNO_02390 [Kitasatospora sp. NPDC006697]|uniref:hypothetical protein n=1 Tax=Kitasatospora sp. NPDC006697 TaxID=3364020 RepID=UPI0036ADE504